MINYLKNYILSSYIKKLSVDSVKIEDRKETGQEPDVQSLDALGLNTA